MIESAFAIVCIVVIMGLLLGLAGWLFTTPAGLMTLTACALIYIVTTEE